MFSNLIMDIMQKMYIFRLFYKFLNIIYHLFVIVTTIEESLYLMQFIKYLILLFYIHVAIVLRPLICNSILRSIIPLYCVASCIIN